MKHTINTTVTCFLLCTLFAATGHSKHPAEEKLISSVDAVLDALFDDEAATLSNAGKRKRVRAVVDERLDFSFIVRRAFGRNWQRLDSEQQEEVVNLVTETLITTYVESFAGSQRPVISYGRLVEVSSNRIEVPSTVEANGRQVRLLYRMGNMQSGWEVFDVVAEGVSMVANYRQQLDNHFRRGNAESLLKRFREMAAKGEVEL
jgi:phospholipid transport system substrate-binding protein